jgi:hypothetical protein
MFIDGLKKELKNTKKITENGAVGFSTSGHKILDMNFKTSSYRQCDNSEIERDFLNCLTEDALVAIKFLFFARDVRGGMGERRLFQVALTELARVSPKTVIRLLPIIPEYGFWEDIFCLYSGLNAEIDAAIISIVQKQIREDYKAMLEGKSVTLLGKWMPRENCHDKVRAAKAVRLAAELKMSPKYYRKMLSNLNEYIGVVECKMSKNEWPKINYENLTSKNNNIYKDAFLRHDKLRREEYLSEAEKGEKKINASTLFPCDIFHKYANAWSEDRTVELLWKNLPDYVKGDESTIVVADGSGSMSSRVGNTEMTAHEVADSLAIYFSERCNGQFKNNYITFSNKPKLVNFGNGSLFSKRRIVETNDECQDTNIEAVFDLILKTAINNGMGQEDLPKNILIISDMEFNSATTYNSRYGVETLFESIKKKFDNAGYKMPRLSFWNVCSRTNVTPVQSNDNGVSLVSGFSPAVISMVLSAKTDPYEVLLDKLNSERYKLVEETLQ